MQFRMTYAEWVEWRRRIKILVLAIATYVAMC